MKAPIPGPSVHDGRKAYRQRLERFLASLQSLVDSPNMQDREGKEVLDWNLTFIACAIDYFMYRDKRWNICDCPECTPWAG
jgi:hypothetical protein